MSDKITSPEQVFGFQMGADKEIASWDKIVEYFNLLDEQSDRIKVYNLGPSTEGNPVLLVAISSAENIKNIGHLREINNKLADPRGLSGSQVEALIRDGKATLIQTGSVHPHEIGGTEMMPELAYDLLTRTDEEAEKIRQNVISLFIPCMNPDGRVRVRDWYYKWLGTEYEGCRLPETSNKYAGRGICRDAYGLNLAESHYVVKVMYHDWHPHAWQDHHQMGIYGPRLALFPPIEPIIPHCDPLTWRELAWYGAHMAYKLEEAEKTGALNAAMMEVRWTICNHPTQACFHNIAPLYTESASVKLATPVYVHPSQLVGGRGPVRGFAKSGQAQFNYPHPWEGGWWHFRDIIEQKKVAAWALLDMAARHRETVLKNHYLKAKRQTERGEKGRPYAYVIAPTQHDPLTAIKLIQKLLLLDVEIKRAQKEFTADGVKYPEGTYVIFLSQPNMGLIKILLGRTLFPDDEWNRLPDGTPIPPVPVQAGTDTINEFMGVSVKPIDSRFEGDFEVIKEVIKPAGKLVGESKTGYIFDGRLNDSFQAVNQLLSKGVAVERVDEAVTVEGEALPAGAFLVSPVDTAAQTALKEVAVNSGIKFHSLDKKLDARSHRTKRLRIGMYYRYWGDNAEEGWAEWTMEQFDFPYTILKDADIKRGDLSKDFDVIIIPDAPTAFITGQEKDFQKWLQKARRGFGGIPTIPVYPPEYRSGLGEEGTKALKNFVEEGGALLAFNEACNYAIEYFGLPVKNVVEDLPGKDYTCVGTLNLIVDNSHPLGYGMPEDSFVVVRVNSPVLSIDPSGFNERCEIVVRYPEEPDPERSLLQSGWLIGEEKLYKKSAMLSVKYGEGKVILISFTPQFRGQTHGTFKLLFNCLLS